MRRILIYANGSSSIGLGHVMRTSALGEKLKELEYNVSYLTDKSDEATISVIKDKGFKVIKIDNIISFLNSHIEDKYYAIIVDSYDIEEQYIESFYNIGSKVVYIDDLNNFKEYNMDLVINYAAGAENIIYNGRAEKLLGSKFTPLRKEFENVLYRAPHKNVGDILITIGGADLHNITGEILKLFLREYKNINFHVVLGNANVYKEGIKKKYNGENVYIYENIKYMSSLMNKCDIAISAGGSTIYELCACSISTIALITADNQFNFIHEMRNAVNMPYINLLDNKDKDLHNLKGILRDVIGDYNFRKNLSYAMYNLVDGKGCERIAEEIINSKGENYE
ncbi:MAG: UDP-2,4-diacetamido-2,4,6-trideoxy-beta-L-altropyranose hydrolase [Clostridiaceae bacterium]